MLDGTAGTFVPDLECDADPRISPIPLVFPAEFREVAMSRGSRCAIRYRAGQGVRKRGAGGVSISVLDQGESKQCLADLDLIPFDQRCRSHTLAVDFGSVGRLQILDDVRRPVLVEKNEGMFSAEYEHNWENNVPDLAASFAYFNKVAKELGY